MKTSILHLASLMVIGVLTLGAITTGRSQPRLQTDFRHGIDSLRLKGMPHQMLDEMAKPNGQQRKPSPLRKVSFPQSQIYVIDTAIVRRLGYAGGLGGYRPGDTTRHLYSYNASAMRTCDLTQKQTDERWIDTERRTNTYDANNNMLSDVIDYVDEDKWRHRQRHLYTYDAAGNKLSEVYEDWGAGQWVKSHRQTWTYDSHGKLLTWLNESWSDGQWVGQNRYTYTYDANGNTFTELEEYWSGGRWVNNSRETYIYDGSNNMLLEMYEYWDGQWWKSSCVTHSYDASSNVLKTIPMYWSSTNQRWEYWQYYGYTYDANNNMVTNSWYSLAMVGFIGYDWVLRERHSYAYDANSNLLSDSLMAYSYWLDPPVASTMEVWIYTYDSDNNMIAAWHPGSNTRFLLVDRAGNSNSYTGYRLTLTSKGVVTGVASSLADMHATYFLSQNYPNPFNPATVISYQLPAASEVKLVVFSLLGQQVAELVSGAVEAGDHKVTFDASSLPSGVYFYRLQARPLADGPRGTSSGQGTRATSSGYTETKKLLLVK